MFPTACRCRPGWGHASCGESVELLVQGLVAGADAGVPEDGSCGTDAVAVHEDSVSKVSERVHMRQWF